jgi:hypothetical protein
LICIKGPHAFFGRERSVRSGGGVAMHVEVSEHVAPEFLHHAMTLLDRSTDQISHGGELGALQKQDVGPGSGGRFRIQSCAAPGRMHPRVVCRSAVAPSGFYWDPPNEKARNSVANRAKLCDAVDLVWRNRVGEQHNINADLWRIQARTMVMHVTNDNWLNSASSAQPISAIRSAVNSLSAMR